MRPLAVVDASVAARWVTPTPDRAAALAVLEEFRQERLELYAPTLQRLEVASALWKYHRANILTQHQTETAYEEYLEAAPMFVDSPMIARSALSLAAVHGHSVYDCSYVALSLQLGCDLLTADKRLFRALGRAFPQIHWIGS